MTDLDRFMQGSSQSTKAYQQRNDNLHRMQSSSSVQDSLRQPSSNYHPYTPNFVTPNDGPINVPKTVPR
jgi:hypothetical protein